MEPTTAADTTYRLTRRAQHATAAVLAAREAILTAVTEALPFEQINRAVLSLAYAEGAEAYWALMLHNAEYVTDHDGNDENVTASLQRSTLKLLATGANDTWSGRGNDAQRARFDGLRDAAASLTF